MASSEGIIAYVREFNNYTFSNPKFVTEVLDELTASYKLVEGEEVPSIEQIGIMKDKFENFRSMALRITADALDIANLEWVMSVLKNDICLAIVTHIGFRKQNLIDMKADFLMSRLEGEKVEKAEKELTELERDANLILGDLDAKSEAAKKVFAEYGTFKEHIKRPLKDVRDQMNVMVELAKNPKCDCDDDYLCPRDFDIFDAYKKFLNEVDKLILFIKTQLVIFTTTIELLAPFREKVNAFLERLFLRSFDMVETDKIDIGKLLDENNMCTLVKKALDGYVETRMTLAVTPPPILNAFMTLVSEEKRLWAVKQKCDKEAAASEVATDVVSGLLTEALNVVPPTPSPGTTVASMPVSALDIVPETPPGAYIVVGMDVEVDNTPPGAPIKKRQRDEDEETEDDETSNKSPRT